jgi:hypothetical protein
VEQNARTVLRAPDGKWLPGTPSPSPGRPLSSRHKIAEAIVRDISAAWEKHGAVVLDRLAIEDPGKFAALAAGLVPREFQMSIAPTLPAGLDADDWRALTGLVSAIRERFAGGEEVRAATVCDYVGRALDAYSATPILEATVVTT